MKSIPGYEGLYSAEEDGRIYSHKRGKYLSSLLNKRTGYYQIKLSNDGLTITHKIHRLIALTYIENLENKPQVDHIDRNKTNNSVNNLRWVTNGENKINTVVHSHNRLHEKHIGYDDYSYRFEMNRNGIRILKRFKTLEEAKDYRDAYLAHS